MSNRPSWNLGDAAERCGVSRSTVRRYRENGRFPNAFKDSSGAWRIPLEDLLAVGWAPVPPAHPEPASGTLSAPSGLPGGQGNQTLAERVAELEQALELERVKRQALEQVNRNYEATLDDLRVALRMLEPARREPVEPAQVEPVTAPAEQRDELPSGHGEQADGLLTGSPRKRGLLGWIAGRS